MTMQFLVLTRILCGCVLLTASSPSIAAQDAVPKLNVRPTCGSSAVRTVGVAHAKATEACLKTEREAQENLTKHWSRYTKIDKTSCVGKVSHGGPPSYVELLSCFDIREHAREIRQAKSEAR